MARQTNPNAPETTTAAWIAEALADAPPLVTALEATKILRLSKRTLYRLVAAGSIHAIRAQHAGGSPLVIPRSELARYLGSLGAV